MTKRTYKKEGVMDQNEVLSIISNLTDNRYYELMYYSDDEISSKPLFTSVLTGEYLKKDNWLLGEYFKSRRQYILHLVPADKDVFSRLRFGYELVI